MNLCFYYQRELIVKKVRMNVENSLWNQNALKCVLCSCETTWFSTRSRICSLALQWYPSEQVGQPKYSKTKAVVMRHWHYIAT